MCPSFVGGIVGYRLMCSFADSGKAVRRNTVGDQGSHYGVGPFLAQGVIDGIGTRIVTVSLNLELRA